MSKSENVKMEKIVGLTKKEQEAVSHALSVASLPDELIEPARNVLKKMPSEADE